MCLKACPISRSVALGIPDGERGPRGRARGKNNKWGTGVERMRFASGLEGIDMVSLAHGDAEQDCNGTTRPDGVDRASASVAQGDRALTESLLVVRGSVSVITRARAQYRRAPGPGWASQSSDGLRSVPPASLIAVDTKSEVPSRPGPARPSRLPTLAFGSGAESGAGVGPQPNASVMRPNLGFNPHLRPSESERVAVAGAMWWRSHHTQHFRHA